jgi:imidazolonepropionase-like amidohydrolase
MGAADEVGSISAGKLADLVIVQGDPLKRITDLFDVQGVMLNGRYRPIDQLLE